MREKEADSGSRAADSGSAPREMDALCQELNMDAETAAEALRDFTGILETYTLEGDVVHWLACALYAACRKGWTPTVGKGVVEGNCVSLTRILRSSKLSLIQFFSKMKKWSDMSNLSQDFRERISHLERNFEVSTVIFRKFEPIFRDMFLDPQGEPPRQPRSRKHRRLPCHISDVFKFCWTLFVHTKGNFHMIGDDLVNSYHLLLCCLDLVFANALLCANRKDLINPLFKGLPQDCLSPDYIPPDEPPCVIDRLCELHDGLVVEAKGIKEHYFKPYITKLFHRQILKGNEETLTELLDAPNFNDNNKAVNREYEEFVLTAGDFDERVFLGADADEEIGTPRKIAAAPPEGLLSARMLVESNLQQHFHRTRSLAPSTPLTGRRYLKEKEVMVTPVSQATQSVSRLQSMVFGLRNAPSEQLIGVFRSASRDPTEAILSRAKSMGEAFRQHYTRSTDEQAGSHMDFAESRLKLAEVLYYKVLENVITQEVKRLHGKDVTVLLEHDVFHRSLMACCLEIVLFAYNSQRSFPWILEVFGLPPFYFYKVIEVFIRSEEGLSRDMVKHLNGIEEQVLESRAWSADSALWEALEAVPTVEEVNFSGSFETGNSGSSGPAHLPMVTLSPIVHPRLREVRTGLGGSGRKDVPPSPISLHDRYSSPIAGFAKRRLFGDEPQSPPPRISLGQSGGALRIVTTSPSAGGAMTRSPARVLFTMATAPVTTSEVHQLSIPLSGLNKDGGGAFTIIQMAGGGSPSSPQVLLMSSPSRASPSRASPGRAAGAGAVTEGQGGVRPRRTGSLALFFRKVYHLASVRLRDLCLKLDVSGELRGKMWTCFEHSLIHCTDLMKDRHLDQLLLCAVYIASKISKEERSFLDIMECYRSQPQASSHVYRSVLLRAAASDQGTDENSMDVEGCAPQADRGDLVQFYNTVYVPRMMGFAQKYAGQGEDHRPDAPPLSPFPSVRSQPLSPRRVSQRHSIFVSPHKNGSCVTPNSAFTYKFNGSPSKELSDINRMIRQGGVSRKRAFTMEEDGSESPTKRLCQESEDVLLKRLQDVVSERAHH